MCNRLADITVIHTHPVQYVQTHTPLHKNQIYAYEQKQIQVYSWADNKMTNRDNMLCKIIPICFFVRWTLSSMLSPAYCICIRITLYNCLSLCGYCRTRLRLSNTRWEIYFIVPQGQIYLGQSAQLHHHLKKGKGKKKKKNRDKQTTALYSSLTRGHR